ncbi:TPA: cardiolipin synthase [Clostridium perfringens]|uniref:cardiolipin synthase n=1 Tax=Clostridium perfringens TaxID=1502 RepID=UPI001CCB06F7|nr:cardiolipin synthase [Clostridium perfringens]MDK0767080.1 cardiolipin synthase [Clostridium perfringens]MDU1812082.1 cardiolipin synthase [Clostridium perfringens]MDU2049252.1 cardiolipin synthase [Clostridium perfringens]MDU2781801.1 cardiolipin synthase [Clostridium perfringens]MDU3378390.1 cardiolipin synthase [Clostridium perfringens]
MINYTTTFLYLAFIINVILSVIIVVLERKQPEKTIAWLLILTLLPPIGLILYIFLGRNWKRHKLNDRINPKINDLISPILDEYTEKQYVPLMELLAFNSDSPIFVNNDIKIYKDGVEKFKDLKEELLKAKHHIHLEYYIVNSDEIGNEIKDILIKKALEGVKVRFIIDKVGSSSLKRSYIKDLKKAGVSVVMYSYFLAPLLKVINTQINYRNHRKIVVIDGQVGFLGGINIGDEYLGRNKKFGYWRDTHIMIKGDFVLALQAVFLDDFITIEKANNSYTFYDKEFDKYFPENIVAKERVLMQLVKSGPDSTFPAIMQSVLKMIMTARENIYITTPYFVPPSSIIEALRIASLSGVDVKIIFPEKSDHFMVNKASKSYLAELMDCGIEVYFYDKSSFIHSKTMTIDGKICTLGTANMDIRSFELNYEINTVIYDKEITCKLDALFFEDLLKSRHFKIEEYEKSTKFDKFIEGFARIFSSLL